MTSKEKRGIVVLIVLFAALIVTMLLVVSPAGPGHDPAESVFVKQRIINLHK